MTESSQLSNFVFLDVWFRNLHKSVAIIDFRKHSKPPNLIHSFDYRMRPFSGKVRRERVFLTFPPLMKIHRNDPESNSDEKKTPKR